MTSLDDGALRRCAFAIFNFGKGIGGHYLSMQEVARSGAFDMPVVIDLGFAPSPLLDEVRTRFIPHRWYGHSAARRELRHTFANAGIEFVLCYDIASYNITRRAVAGSEIAVVYVKCGGPVLTRYFPKAPHLVVFSDEDAAFFRERLPQAVMAQIPHRVSEDRLRGLQIPLAPEACAALRPEDENMVCIARIGRSYESKILCAFDWLRRRKAEGRPATLTVIGSVQQPEIYDRLRKDAPPGTQFLTDGFHVTDAARFLSCFNVAVTTGRGTVEAVLLGLKTLVPFDKSDPKLAPLTPATYEALRRTNFSGRARADELPRPLPTFDSDQDEDLRVRVRADFSVESAAPLFRALRARSRPEFKMPLGELLLGALYFYYEASRERNRIVREIIHKLRHSRRANKREI